MEISGWLSSEKHLNVLLLARLPEQVARYCSAGAPTGGIPANSNLIK